LEFVLVGVVLIGAAVFFMAVAVIALMRTETLRKALLETEARLRAIESQSVNTALSSAAIEGAIKERVERAIETAVRERALIAPPAVNASKSGAGEPALIPAPDAASQIGARGPTLAAAGPKPSTLQPESAEPTPPMVRTIPSAEPPQPPEPTPSVADPPLLGEEPGGQKLSIPTVLAGVALAVGALFLLRLAEDQGIFGPTSQLFFGYLIAGAMFLAGEYLWRQPAATNAAQAQNRGYAALFSVIGVFGLFAAPYYAVATLKVLPQTYALALMGVGALIGLGLSLRHGWLLAAAGIAGGYLAPSVLQVGQIDAGAAPFFAYLFMLTAAALTLARYRQWAPLAWVAGALSLMWGAWWVNEVLSADRDGIVFAAAYGLVIAGLGVVLAYEESDGKIGLEPPWAPKTEWSAFGWAGQALILGAGLFVLHLFGSSGAATLPPAVALVFLTGALTVLATLRQGFALAPVGIGVLCLAALALWPIELNDGDQPRWLIFAAGALGAIASVGGMAMMSRRTTDGARGPGAFLASLIPAGVLMTAHGKIGAHMQDPVFWGAAALFLGLLQGWMMDRVASQFGGPKKAPGATAAFGVGAVSCAAMAASFGLSGFVMIAAIAAIAAPLAFIDKRIDFPALRWAAGAIGAIVTVTLVLSPAPLSFPVETTPLLNQLTLGYGVAIGAFWLTARLTALGPDGYEGRFATFMRICVMALIVAFATMLVRHLANGGMMRAPYATLWEMGGHVSVWIAAALAITLRYRPPLRRVAFIAEALLFVAGAILLAIGGLIVLNPWWGVRPPSADGWPFANALAVGYLAPALAFALYGAVKQSRGGPMRATIAYGLALGAALVWALLEVRRAFHGPLLAPGDSTWMENLALSSVLILGAGLTFMAASFKGFAALRYVSAGLVAAAVAKGLLVDVNALEGLARYAAISGLIILAGLAFIGYQRFVFAPPMGDASLQTNSATPPAAPAE
jgi:uncharacterized membrane protein